MGIKNMKKTKLLLAVLGWVFLVFLIPLALAEESDYVCGVYITGVGCPNCAITDPVLLSEYTAEFPDLIIIEYEIYWLSVSNQPVAQDYFKEYMPFVQAGVPFLIFNQENTALGRFGVLGADKMIKEPGSNECPLKDGSSISFEELDLTSLSGKIKIWRGNRILISDGGKGDSELLKKLLVEDISEVLEEVKYKEVKAEPVQISEAEVEFEKAIKVGGWILQWNEGEKEIEGVSEIKGKKFGSWWIIGLAALLGVFLLMYLFLVRRKKICFVFSERQKNFMIIGVALLLVVGFFILAKYVSADFLKAMGAGLPLPMFTFFIALVDGFNPCNLFVLTLLLGLLVSASHSRKRIYTIGYTFVFVVFVVYFLFMAAWLNIFKFIGFIDPLRIGIAIVALVAGLINCKELLFFRKGITLMIQEKHKGPLIRRVHRMNEIIINGSLPALVLASMGLAAFASLVELPCTAGFPIIYAAVLTGKFVANGLGYYGYLFLYNLVYVIPLAVVIGIFGWTFKGKQISKRQMQIIKFIGGFIMILLGIVLLVNPGMIGIG